MNALADKIREINTEPPDYESQGIPSYEVYNVLPKFYANAGEVIKDLIDNPYPKDSRATAWFLGLVRGGKVQSRIVVMQQVMKVLKGFVEQTESEEKLSQYLNGRGLSIPIERAKELACMAPAIKKLMSNLTEEYKDTYGGKTTKKIRFKNTDFAENDDLITAITLCVESSLNAEQQKEHFKGTGDIIREIFNNKDYTNYLQKTVPRDPPVGVICDGLKLTSMDLKEISMVHQAIDRLMKFPPDAIELKDILALDIKKDSSNPFPPKKVDYPIHREDNGKILILKDGEETEVLPENIVRRMKVKNSEEKEVDGVLIIDGKLAADYAADIQMATNLMLGMKSLSDRKRFSIDPDKEKSFENLSYRLTYLALKEIDLEYDKLLTSKDFQEEGKLFDIREEIVKHQTQAQLKLKGLEKFAETHLDSNIFTDLQKSDIDFRHAYQKLLLGTQELFREYVDNAIDQKVLPTEMKEQSELYLKRFMPLTSANTPKPKAKITPNDNLEKARLKETGSLKQKFLGNAAGAVGRYVDREARQNGSLEWVNEETTKSWGFGKRIYTITEEGNKSAKFETAWTKIAHVDGDFSAKEALMMMIETKKYYSMRNSIKITGTPEEIALLHAARDALSKTMVMPQIIGVVPSNEAMTAARQKIEATGLVDSDGKINFKSSSPTGPSPAPSPSG